MKLFDASAKAGRHVGSRFPVQPLCPGISRFTAAAFRSERLRFRTDLGVVVRALPTSGVTSCNLQPLGSDVVLDHTRLRLAPDGLGSPALSFAIWRPRTVEHAGYDRGQRDHRPLVVQKLSSARGEALQQR